MQAAVLPHILSAILEVIRTGVENPQIEDVSDERDRLIGLRGTKVTCTVSSTGVFLAKLRFVFGQPALVRFTLLILVGILAQLIGDGCRLVLYRRGF